MIKILGNTVRINLIQRGLLLYNSGHFDMNINEYRTWLIEHNRAAYQHELDELTSGTDSWECFKDLLDNVENEVNALTDNQLINNAAYSDITVTY